MPTSNLPAEPSIMPRSTAVEFDEHGGLAGQEGVAGVDGLAAVIGHHALIVHLLPPVHDRHAFGAVEDGLGGEAVAAVVVVDKLAAGDGQELLEEPAVDGEGGAVDGGLIALFLGQLAGGFFELSEGARRFFRIEPGGLEHILVVVQQRGRGVEGHRVLLAIDRVVGQHVRLQVGDIVLFFVDEVLDGGDHLQVDHQAGADVEQLHHGRGILGLQAGFELVERVIVGALVDRLNIAFLLRGVEIVGHLRDGFAADITGHRVPEGDLGGAGALGRRDGRGGGSARWRQPQRWRSLGRSAAAVGGSAWSLRLRRLVLRRLGGVAAGAQAASTMLATTSSATSENNVFLILFSLQMMGRLVREEGTVPARVTEMCKSPYPARLSL